MAAPMNHGSKQMFENQEGFVGDKNAVYKAERYWLSAKLNSALQQ